MPRINVTVQELNRAADVLEELNRVFITRVNELDNLEVELGSMWQGEANSAFSNAFENDRVQWAEFAVVINRYINSLRSIAAKYANAEERNTSVARNDSSSNPFSSAVIHIDWKRLMPLGPCPRPTIVDLIAGIDFGEF